MANHKGQRHEGSPGLCEELGEAFVSLVADLTRRETYGFFAVCQAVQDNVGRVIIGKADIVELLLTALLVEGHVLIEDVPGIGKTTLAKALATQPGPAVRAHPVHARPAAVRRHGAVDLQPEGRRVRVPAGPRLQPRAPGRRDQPGDAAHAVGPAGGDAGAPGDGRRPDLPARRRPSWCWRRRTRSSWRGRSRCPRRSRTAS